LFAHSGSVERFPVKNRNVQYAHREAGEVAEVDDVAALDEILNDGLQQTPTTNPILPAPLLCLIFVQKYTK